MRTSARIENGHGEHRATVTTERNSQTIAIAPASSGPGSGVNGGGSLFPALATCYGDDLCRETAMRGIKVERVEVDVEGSFGGEGEPASGVTYRARVVADAGEAAIRDLMRHMDTVAEMQNTPRPGMPVTLVETEALYPGRSAPAGDPIDVTPW